MNYHLAFSKSWITNIHWLLVGITCQFYGCVFVCVKSSGVVKRTFGEIQHPKKNTYFSSTIWHWVFPTLMCACMLSHFNCIQLFVTLWTVAFQAPLSMGLSRQKYWSRLSFPTLEDVPDPGIESAPPAFGRQILYYTALPVNLQILNKRLSHCCICALT